MSTEDHPNAAGGNAAGGTYNPIEPGYGPTIDPPDPVPGYCEGVLMLAGQHYRCDWPLGDGGHHRGWAHTSRAAQAVWAGPPTEHISESGRRHADAVRNSYR